MKHFVFLLLFPLIVFSQKEQMIDSGNSKLHFRIFGKGEPILIINGGPGMNSEGFSNVAEKIAQLGFQTITYDQRGTGKSVVAKADNATITMALMAQDIENLRQYLNIKKWTILGHSFGGIMAAYYADAFPGSIDKLIFSSSGGIDMKFTSYLSQTINGNLTKIEKDSLDYFQRKRDHGDQSLQTLKNRARFLANAYVYDKKNAPTIAARLIQINFDVNALVIANLNSIHYNYASKFKDFYNPVLVLQGKNDIIKMETARELAAAYPNSKLIEMEHCGHYGWLDAPEVYFQSIKSFLNS